MAIGVGAEGIELDAGALTAAVLGVGVAAALFWTYFDAAPESVEQRLEATPAGRERNVMARDGYSFLHLPMVAGIVLLALGVKKTLGDVDHELKLVAAVALCGGVALYLLADAGFRRRTLDRREVAARARRGRAAGGDPARHRRAGARRARGRRRAHRRARRLRGAQPICSWQYSVSARLSFAFAAPASV